MFLVGGTIPADKEPARTQLANCALPFPSYLALLWRDHTTNSTHRGWCCRKGLNFRPLPYQGSALPLSYGSIPTLKANIPGFGIWQGGWVVCPAAAGPESPAGCSPEPRGCGDVFQDTTALARWCADIQGLRHGLACSRGCFDDEHCAPSGGQGFRGGAPCRSQHRRMLPGGGRGVAPSASGSFCRICGETGDLCDPRPLRENPNRGVDRLLTGSSRSPSIAKCEVFPI